MRANQKTYLKLGLKHFLKEINEWETFYSEDIFYISKQRLTWDLIFKILGNILKERHPIIQYVIFLRKNRHLCNIHLILDDNSMVIIHQYGTLNLHTGFDINQIVSKLLQEIYSNYSIKYDINEPIYLD